MKKFFTLIMVAAISSVAYGQRLADLSVKTIVSPDKLESTDQGTLMKLNLEVYNDGPDDLMIGDTLYYSMILANLNNQVITQLPQDAHLGYVTVGLVLTRNVNAGDTIHFLKDINIALLANNTFEVNVIASIFAQNRPDLVFEGSASNTDNRKTVKIIWYNKDKFPLSSGTVVMDGLTVYPNPASELTTIQLSAVEIGETTTLRVFDVNGKEVFIESKAAGVADSFELNTSLFENGIYMVQVSSGSQIRSSKLVVQH
ncbi:MAG TPA: hypothetical protein DIW47_05115 [Bacteroidetes bacterium]|nr:hypothetical protein [Bacteroidota bacterium]